MTSLKQQDHKQHDKRIVAKAQAKAQVISKSQWDLLNVATNIDRSQSHRSRPMEILCLGLERTGTLSLRTALFELGYFDVYHFSSIVMENPPDAKLWLRAIDAKFHGRGNFDKTNWDQLLGHCMAVTDQPCATFAEELLEAYPDAKVILTVRDSPQVWYKSFCETVLAIVDLECPLAVREPGWNPFSWLRCLLHPVGPFLEFMEELTYAREVQRNGWASPHVYDQHNNWIRRMVREQEREFLEFNVKQGWQPLCQFLRKPAPDQTFPHVNDKTEWKDKLVETKRKILIGYAENALKIFGLPLAAATLGYICWRGRNHIEMSILLDVLPSGKF